MIEMVTTKGTYHGRSIESIIRTRFGRNAYTFFDLFIGYDSDHPFEGAHVYARRPRVDRSRDVTVAKVLKVREI